MSCSSELAERSTIPEDRIDGASGSVLERVAVYPPAVVAGTLLVLDANNDHVIAASVAPAAIAGALLVALVQGALSALPGDSRRVAPPLAAGCVTLLLLGLVGTIGWVAMGLVLLGAVLLRSRPSEKGLAGLTLALNLFGLCYVGMALLSRVGDEVVGIQQELSTLPSPVLDVGSSPPSILHVMLDGYGDPAWLDENFGCGTSIVEGLEARGFHVVEGARPNYGQTLLSMASMMNMQLLEEVDWTHQSRRPLYNALLENRVVEGLQAQGYRVDQVVSECPTIRADQRGTREPLIPLNIYDRLVLRMSAATPISVAMGQPAHRALHELHLRRLRFAFEAGSQPLSSGPVWRFVHVIGPHPPFVIHADGSYRPDPTLSDMEDGVHWADRHGGSYEAYADGYCEKASFVGNETLAMIDRILQDDPEVVILVHGDHGPGYELDWDDLESSNLQARFGVLLAARGPEAMTSRLQDGISLVNVYPAILGGLFGAELPRQPDRQLWSPWHEPWRTIDITGTLNAEAQ